MDERYVVELSYRVGLPNMETQTLVNTLAFGGTAEDEALTTAAEELGGEEGGGDIGGACGSHIAEMYQEYIFPNQATANEFVVQAKAILGNKIVDDHAFSTPIWDSDCYEGEYYDLWAHYPTVSVTIDSGSPMRCAWSIEDHSAKEEGKGVLSYELRKSDHSWFLDGHVKGDWPK